MPQLPRSSASFPRADKELRRLETPDKSLFLSIVGGQPQHQQAAYIARSSKQTSISFPRRRVYSPSHIRRLRSRRGITGELSWARFNAASGARSADVVLPRSLLRDLPPLDHSIDTYSLRCGREGVWARIFAEPVLLLFLLFDH